MSEQLGPGSLSLLLPMPPSSNRYWRQVDGRMLISREGRDYRQRCGTIALVQDAHPLLGSLAVSARYLNLRRNADLDNRAKQLLDALNGVAWRDDNQIVELHLYRCQDTGLPRVEVQVEVVT